MNDSREHWMSTEGRRNLGVSGRRPQRLLVSTFIRQGTIHHTCVTDREGARASGGVNLNKLIKLNKKGCSTTGVDTIVHFGSVGRLQGLFERSKAHPARG